MLLPFVLLLLLLPRFLLLLLLLTASLLVYPMPPWMTAFMSNPWWAKNSSAPVWTTSGVSAAHPLVSTPSSPMPLLRWRRWKEKGLAMKAPAASSHVNAAMPYWRMAMRDAASRTFAYLHSAVGAATGG